MLATTDPAVIRDIAVKHDSDGTVELSEAIALLELAHRLRPDGSYIARKLREYRELAAREGVSS